MEELLSKNIDGMIIEPSQSAISCQHQVLYDQMDAMGIYQEVFRRGDDGRLLYVPRLLTDLDSFLRTWSTNIQDQGFNPAQAFQAPQTAND